MATRAALWLTMFWVVPCLGARPSGATRTGMIIGTLEKGSVTAVFAVDRANDKKSPGKRENSTGRFTIAGLPLDNDYDVVIDAPAGRLEGVNLKVPRSDYEEEQPLAKEDIKTISDTARSLNQFEDKVEVLAINGNIQHAAVVLLKLRTRPFYEAKPGEMIWRLELWHFERPDETWVKTQDELFTVFYRERLQKSVYDKKSITLDPHLGGLRPTRKQTTIDIGRIQPPEPRAGIRVRPGKNLVREQNQPLSREPK